MTTQNSTEKKIAHVLGTCSGAPLTTAKNKGYLETQFFINTKDGRTIKVYSFNKTAAAVMHKVEERQELIIFGKFIASDAFKLTGFKDITAK
jgi:general stress protein 26